MQFKARAVAGAAAIMLAASAAQATVIFSDTYGNGNTRHTDTTQWYWFYPTAAAFTETDGSLYFTQPATNPNNSYEAVGATNDANIVFPRSGADSPIMVSFRGLAFNTATNNTRWDFGIMAGGTFPSSADSVQTRVDYNPSTNSTTVRLGQKVDAPNPTDSLIGGIYSTTFTGKLSGYDLTITPGGYTWTLFGDPFDVDGSTVSGTFGTAFTPENWDQANGASNLRMRYQVFGAIDTPPASIGISELVITAVPEPGMLSVIGLAGLALMRRRKV